MSTETQEKLNTKGRGLGRGLGALFGDEEDVYPSYDAEKGPMDSPSRKVIGIEQIFANPDQPRRHFDETALKELAASIKEHGLLQPIMVRPSKSREGMYEIVAGERRWRAAQKAKLHEIPAVIRDLNDDEMFQIALVENLQRQDLDPIEEAMGYQKLVKDFGHSAESIGDLLGKSRSHIANLMRLLSLPADIQMMVQSGDLSAGHARALIGCDNAFDLALEVIKNNLSVRDTEKLVAANEGREIKSRPKAKKAGFSAKDADTLALEKEVSDQIGMRVTIDMKDDRKGKMTIDFSSLDQLDDVLQRLAQTPKRH